MSNSIAIIGAGNIGSRHLQALALIDRELEIYVVDPNSDALVLAKNRFEELPSNNLVQSVSYLKDLDGLDDIDVAIVATSADIRKQVIEKLLAKINVRYFILEKVAFQSAGDFESVMELIRSQGSEAWVNCSYRRLYPSYQKIKGKFNPGEQIYFSLWGGGWGLACNSIHLMDLFSYLTDETDITLDGSQLDRAIMQSKREDFIELAGILRGKTNNGSEMTLLDYPGEEIPYVIQILSKEARFVIFESQQRALSATKKDNWEWKDETFPILYQSQMTHLLIQDILDAGDCALASIEEAYRLHKPMLNIFINHLNNVTGKTHELCPVT